MPHRESVTRYAIRMPDLLSPYVPNLGFLNLGFLNLGLLNLGVLALAAVWSGAADARINANAKIAVDRIENTNPAGQRLLLPYAFSTESMGFTVGLGGMIKGFYQEQMTIGGTVFGGPENHGAALGLWDFRFPQSRRLFITALGMMGYFPRQLAYAPPPNVYWPADQPRPGSNDSSPDAVLQSSGVSNWWEIKLEYALPIGATRHIGLTRYQLAEGMLISETSGGRQWNPLESGASVLMLRQYNQYQTFEFEKDTLSGALHAFELGLLYDNTDFPLNPSFGSKQYIGVHHDPAWLESRDKWSFLEIEASKYFSLGASRYALQRVIAINGWTAYSPSWNLEYNENGGSRVAHAPPYLEGANLGGFYRMRGYDQYRFHDKAAVYAAAEYRHTLRWNPLRGVSWLQFLASDWLQLVAYAEGGRVAPEYTARTLFSDWKSDVGLALRGMFGGVVVRLDWGHSTEGNNVWAMVGHPF